MRNFLSLFAMSCFFFCSQVEGASRYWLIQQDFIRLGKRELYEEERKKVLEEDKSFFKKKKTPFEVIGFQDLENPQYAFLMPLKNLSVLDLYAPIHPQDSALFNTCLHFQLFSLHELLEDCSFRSPVVFSAERPFISYSLYDIEPGTQKSFENHMVEVALKQSKKSLLSWNTWKVVLGGDTPKYLICASFETKEDLKNADMDKVFEELQLKDILRNRKSGWMKIETSLSSFKK